MKRLITSMLIVLLLCVAFIGSFYKGYYSYAEDINYMSDAELEAAYQAYLQSKGGGFLGNAGARLAYTNGKMLNFLTSDFNTTPYKNINEVKGLMSWEKAELESGNSSVLQLTMRHPEVFSLYTQWLLQNHYFGNGVSDTDGMFDDGVDNNIYSGELVNDYDGNTALVWHFVNTSTLDAKGSFYRYTNSDIMSESEKYGNDETFNMVYHSNNSTDRYLRFNKSYNSYYKHMAFITASTSGNVVNGYIYRYDFQNLQSYNVNGYPIIYKLQNDATYYLGIVQYDSSVYKYTQFGAYDTSAVTPNINLFFYTNTNNNITNYPNVDVDGTLYIRPKVNIDGEYKPYIINEGDTVQNVVNNYYNDSGEKDKTISVPSTTPDSGSGGGGSSGGTPPNWSNPYPNLSPDGNGGFNFNFTLPDLNIDWNINGLSEKFPFSIPFDLIRFVSVLNAEPETPHFEGTVNLIVYEWNIDADLSDFDNLAGIVRNIEFIGFCITLILITRRMIKG